MSSTSARAGWLGALPIAAAMAVYWFGAGESRAQAGSSASGASGNNPMSASLDNMLAYSRMGRVIGTTPASGARGKAVAAASRAPASTTTFTAGRRTFLEGIPPAHRSRARQLLPTCDKIYAETMNMAGLTDAADRLDLASSSAFYLELARSIYWRGQPGAPPEARAVHLRNLRERLKQGYLTEGTFIGMTDAEKQASHDALLFTVCLPTLQFFDAARTNDETAKQAARTAAARLLAKFSLYPTSFRYKADGSVEILPGPGG